VSVTISESGLLFGEYEESELFHVEKSTIYKSLGDGICTVEFVLRRSLNEILFVEAKSSSPKPNNREDFDEFITGVCEKFAHSIDIFFSLVLRRLDDRKNEMPASFREVEYSTSRLKLVLVIKGHDIRWLSPINDAIKRKLQRQLKTWLLEIAVMNHDLADEYGLLKLGG